MAIKMESMEDESRNETQTEGRAIEQEQGIPEREPETIGEALKRCYRDRRSRACRERSSRAYYEEQLTHSASIKTETGRKAALLQILAVHSASFN